jgi:UPF0716 protein FxsA
MKDGEYMFRWILLIMVVIPAVEIWGLIMIGQLIGGWMTFLLILLTGFFGAFLAKREGKKVWHYARHQMAHGQIPALSILDGICIFAGGLMLLTPGFFTDLLGFLLVFSGSRAFFRAWLLWMIQKLIASGRITRL